MVAALWSEVLGTGPIRPDDAVVPLGADSLHMNRMVARVRRTFGVRIPFRVIFGAATPAALADVIRTHDHGEEAQPAEPAHRAGPRATLSQDQRRLWLLDQNGEGTAAYNLPMVLRLRGPLDLAALRAALRDVVDRHGALRTRVVVADHQDWQEVGEPADIELPVVEVDGTVENVLDTAMALVNELTARRFDLTAAPPWRATVYRLAPEDHLVAFVLHHLVFDGWSEAILRTELSRCYAARLAGVEPDLAPVPLQYSQWADWQAEQEQAADFAPQLRYWREKLSDLAVVDLPADRPRPAQGSDRGAGHAFTVDAATVAAARAVAHENGATPFMVLLSTWVALLGRYCGQSDVSTGTSMAGRTHADLETLIGSFVNIFVIRADLGGQPSLVDLLNRVKETTLEAFANQDVPFDRLVADLAPARSAARNPLFNVMFAYLNMPVAQETWQDLTVEQLRPVTTRATFDVTLSLQDQPDGSIRGHLEYSTDLFDAESMTRLGTSFTRLLAGAVADPARPVDRVALLSDDERRQLLAEPRRIPLSRSTVPAAVADRTARTPDAVAVVSGGERLTYAELSDRAAHLANRLRHVGVGPERGVAIRLPRGVDQIVALLGVLTAGGYAVPLDDEHPAERVAGLLGLAHPYALVTVGDEREHAGHEAGVERVVRLDQDEHVSDVGADLPPVVLDADHLAAAIFTSGSSGTPKAVAITHDNLLFAHAARAVHDLTPDRVLLPVSFAFDVFISFVVSTLAAGGSLVIPVRERGVDTDELAQLLREQRVTHLVAPPNLQRSLLARDDVRAGNHLVAGIVGGEACPRLLAEDYRSWTRGARLFNEYGLTETSSASTEFVVDETLALDGHAGQLPIGGPMANVRAYLLDDALELAPVGVAAELYLSGPGITRGYLGDSARTAERFVPDPFGPPGSRLCRTGDIARWDRDGNLQFLGRRDGQVKVRGLRIELAEVEAALARDPAVAEAAVCQRADDGHLIAFVTAAAGAEPDVEQLRAHLLETLPEPMVPTAIGRLAQLPTTATGKVDRAALAETPITARVKRAHTGPRSPAEHTVAGVWAEILELSEVDIHTDFFTLGGHSLLAADAVSRLRGAFPVPIGLRDLFGAPTVAGLAALIGERVLEAMREQFGVQPSAEADSPQPVEEPAAPAAPAIPPADRTSPLPLSAGQEQLWLQHEMSPDSAAYQMPSALRLRGALHLEALRDALTNVVARHEVLRTRIDLVDDEPVQLVDPAGPVLLPVVDAGSPEAADAVMRAELVRPFDLRGEHPLRAIVCRLADDDHTLLVVAHHVACDGASIQLLLAELAEEYDAAVSGGAARVAEPALQYADYAAWYRDRTATPEYRDQRAYWRDQLAGVRPVELPLAPPVPDPMADAGGCLSFELGQELSERLHRYAARRSVTPFVVLLATLNGLLHRLGCGTDLAVGTPVSGRGRAELDQLLGYFGNILVLRADVSGAPDFDELVDRLRAVTTDGLAAQDVALADVVRDIGAPRAGARNPLFNVLFAHEYAATGQPSFTGLSAEVMPLPVDAVQFDLSLRLTEHPDGTLTGELDHLAAAVDAAYARRIIRWYVRLLDLALSTPDSAVIDLPLLDDSDLAELDRWNDTAVAAERSVDRCLHDLVVAQARRTPDAVAVTAGDTRLSYQELVDRASVLAHRLRANGVRTGSVVAVCLPRSTDLSVAVLGVSMSGAMFLPLDPTHPSGRLAGVLRRHAAVVLLSTSDTIAAWETPPPTPVVLDPADAWSGPVDGPLPEVHPDDAAYLITTSGSTGEPKGVVVPHGGIVNRIRWAQRRYDVGGGDKVLQKTSVSFDPSIWELFGPLASGGTVVMASPGVERDPAALVADIIANQVTILQAVPTMFRLLSTEPDLAACTSLRLLMSAGEVLTEDLCRTLVGRVDARLDNSYGPTECSIDITAWTYVPGEPAGGPVPIGAPGDNLRVHIMDDRQRRVPVGVVGELYLAGVGVATGYNGRPDLTADRFVPDPVSPTPGGRLYRTGDVARWRPDGNVEFLGRRDRQVKIRGIRTEPAEIESVLTEHPGLRAAAVVPKTFPGGDVQLVAYVVPAHGDQLPADLDGFLAARLQSAVIPARLLVLTELPVTGSGKVDRNALPEPEHTLPTGDSHVAPRTATEELVTTVWAEVLGVERVGVTDDLFMLGGHSLTAARITARLRAAVDQPVSLADVLTTRTPENLARHLDSLATDGGTGLGSVSRGDPVLLSFAQQRLWFLEQLTPGGVAYLAPWVLRLRGAVDVEALRGAVRALVARHEVLRTRFGVRNGVPAQVIDEASEVDLAVVDVGGDVERVVSAECARPIDLVSGPVVRARLLRCGPDDHVLVVVSHHAACDGWSVGVLARELRLLYAAGGDGSALPAVGVQYADFAAWQRGWLSGGVLAREVAFWRERLVGVVPLELPTDRPRPIVPDDAGDTVEFTVPAELATRLVDLGHQHGATPFMVLFAVYASLLSRYTRESDISVGVPVAGRHWPDIENTVGLFVNTLVLRTQVEPTDTFVELLDRVRGTTLDAFAHQELPFERLVDELRIDRDLSRNPLFQLMFELHEVDDESESDWDGLAVRPMPVARDTSKFDLTFALARQRDGSLAGEVEYATALFDRESVERLVTHFTRLATAIAAAPARQVALHPLLAGPDRATVLDQWSGIGGPDIAAECLPDLLADRFRRAPDAVVVTDGVRDLTAAQLDAAANQMAHHLRDVGVEPEQRVAVLLRRSVDVPGVLLGVLRAGGVYVPIDPASPPERLRFLLEDTGAEVIITSQEHLNLIPAAKHIVIDTDRDAIADRPTTPPPVTLTPGSLAYVIYTSGSTGRPKGVMIEHGSYAHHCRVIADGYDIREGDRVALLSALTFDVAMDQVGATLLAGATVVVGGDDLWSPAELPDRLGDLGITHLEITPAHYRELMRGVSEDDPRLRSLRLMNVGSDVVTVDDVRRWHASGLPGRFLCNYGPTEATVTCLLHDHDLPESTSESRTNATMPIGRPVSGTRAYIVDDLLNPVPVGVAGELLLGGVRLARGYLGRPDLTAERFVPDPFGDEPGARLYRTGDLVRYRADGVIEFLGRIDTQVKIRGFRIELGEIEMILGEQPGVAAVAVTVYEPRPGDRVLAAYIVPAESSGFDVDALRAALAARVPEYMVPSYWTELDALPLTTSTKVDRRALPTPADRGAAATSPPESDAELAVAEVWAEVLGRSDIGVTDNFFNLGGHSLLATRVRALFEERFGVDLPLRSLFQAVTVATQAREVEEALLRDFEELPEDEMAAMMSEMENR